MDSAGEGAVRRENQRLDGKVWILGLKVYVGSLKRCIAYPNITQAVSLLGTQCSQVRVSGGMSKAQT